MDDHIGARIRAATPEDVEAIAVIHHESWNSSARHLLPASALATKTVEHRQGLWRDKLTRPQARTATLVAESDTGEILGFVDVSASDDPAVGEVNKLFVAPHRKGRGVGGALLAAGVAQLAGMGFGRAVLWSLTGNEPAASFYRSNGWRPTTRTGQVDIDQTDLSLPVTEYGRTLPPSSPGRTTPSIRGAVTGREERHSPSVRALR